MLDIRNRVIVHYKALCNGKKSFLWPEIIVRKYHLLQLILQFFLFFCYCNFLFIFVIGLLYIGKISINNEHVLLLSTIPYFMILLKHYLPMKNIRRKESRGCMNLCREIHKVYISLDDTRDKSKGNSIFCLLPPA